MKKDVKELFALSEEISNKIYSSDIIENLPKPIQRYLKYSLQENQPYISSVRLKHSGTFRPNDKWLPIKGIEYFSAQKPGFVWLGKVPKVSAMDKYYAGEGKLVIKLLSFIKIAEAKGKETNQGELLRWLGEAPLFPTALLPSEHLKWEAIDYESAKVIFTDSDLTVDGIFNVNELGQITSFKAKRYKDTTLEDWTGYYKDYQTVENVKIPFYMEVEWNLSSGDYSYAKFTIDEIEYNKPYSF
ncbi:MAG: DUF6544 family protein [Candidatus Heimdallarchaeota archaeon]